MTVQVRRSKSGQVGPAKPEDALLATLSRVESDIADGLTAEQKIIGDDETFRQWCERLGRDELKVDGRPFMLDRRPAMAWVYDQIPSSIEEAYRYTLVLMKSAQVGFTVMEQLAMIYLGIKFGPATVGMFLPDVNSAEYKSTERFMPILRTIPAAHELMTKDAAEGAGRNQGEGNVRRRRIGDSLYVFSWTSGRATTESVPMDVLSFDEVQEMTLEQLEKTGERISSSKVRFKLLGSTANWPDSDIDHWYKRGTRHRFHTRCPACEAARPLDDYFPECIRWDVDREIHRYVCEAGHWIDDPQIGEWLPENPQADRGVEYGVPFHERRARIRSIHFPQFLSPDMSAGEIIDAYNSATDMKSFFNRKLGKPYLDPSQVPVTLAHMQKCVAAGREAGVVWESRGHNYFMGVDQMGGFNVVIIKKRLPDGRQAVVHLEEIYGLDAFDRLDMLMNTYGIQTCVLEVNPNYNEAKKFANRFPGRVFICDSFGNLKEDMIIWGDTPKLDPSDRRTTEEARDRYTIKVDQYKCMQVSMARFTAPEPLCLWPDPQGLAQEVTDKKQRHVAALAPRAFHHFTKTALVAEKDPDTTQYKRSVRKIGIDPHYSFANQLCDVAWARAHGTATFILSDSEKGSRNGPAALTTVALPGAPVALQALVEEIDRVGQSSDVCGRCDSYQHPQDGTSPANGLCTYRNLAVGPRDPGCPFFVSRAF